MSKKHLFISKVAFIVFIMSLLVCRPVLAAAAIPFSDVSGSHWSLQNIIKMNLRGVVNGYPDNTFRPDQPVTELEAVLMAVRNMDADDQIESMDSSQSLPFTVPSWVDSNSKKELLFAVDEGLIVPAENNFSASAYASRAWMAQLMVRMIGKQNEAAARASDPTSFTDNSSIPGWARGYINVASKYEIISGYPDNSYRPTTDVNRAETAALLNRSEKYLNLGDQVVAARIASIVGNNLTVNVSGTILALQTDSKTWVFNNNGSPGSSSDLGASDYIKYISSGSKVTYIEIQEDTVVQRSVLATVLEVIAEDGLLVAKDSGGNVITEKITSGIGIIDENNKSYQLSELQTGAQVELYMDGKDQLVSILIHQARGSTSNSGLVYSINKDQKLIILKNSAGSWVSYQYDTEPQVKISNTRFASLDDLEVGDEVKVTVVNSLVTQVELVQAKQEVTINGKIALISSDKELLAIDRNGTIESYYMADGYTINISGLSSAVFADLKVNDIVEAQISQGKIVSLKVTNRTANSDLVGTIAAVDIINELIVLKTADGQLKTYEFDDSAQIEVDDDYNASVNDLRKDMYVSIQLLDDKIIYLESGGGIEGTVVSVNSDRHLISILLSGGSTQTYVMVNSPEVNIEDETRPNVDDIEKNDYVELHLKNERVESIDVQRTFDYQILRIDEEDEELRVEDEDGDTKYLYIDSDVDIEIEGVSSPDIDDFNKGDRIKATYMGEELKKVEVSPTVYGQITNIDSTGKKVTIQRFDGVLKTYTFGADSVVIDEDTESDNLNNLDIGDRVQLMDYPGNRIELTLLTVVSGTYSSRSDDKIYINKNGSYSYTYYELSNDCYIHAGSTTLLLRNLNQNDSLDLYVIGDVVYEIVRK